MDSMKIIIMFLSITYAADCIEFPLNKEPIRSIEFDELPSLTIAGSSGEMNGLQVAKQINVAGREMIVVGARAKLIFLDHLKMTPDQSLSTVTPDIVYTWSSDSASRDICVMKGQSKDECDNFIKIIEPLNEAGDKIFVCGTNAYDPMCQTFQATRNADDVLQIIAMENSLVSGKEKCPFGPDQSGVSLYAGGSLYTSTISEFKGRSSVVSRSGENADEPALKTSRHDTNLLNKPNFISMADGGDRVFVFMNEKIENDNGDVKLMSRIAQVCKNDQGGEHVLVKQWTTFVKTRLNCSFHGYYFDELQDISQPRKIKTATGVEEVVIATFTSPEFAAPASAICAFTMDSIRDAMKSEFKTELIESEEGSPTPPSSEHHPGLCPGQQLSPAELQFIKSHPILTKQVSGSLLATDTSKRWTALAIDSEAGPKNDYTVLFIGTSTGQITRYMAPDDKVVTGMPLSIQDVYDVRRCGEKSSRQVERIIINKDTKTVSVFFESCVVNMPMHTCDAHANEEECVLSADPYCGWNGDSCVVYVDANEKLSQNLPNSANNPVVIVPKDLSKGQGVLTVTSSSEDSLSAEEPQSDDAGIVKDDSKDNIGDGQTAAKSDDRINIAAVGSTLPCVPFVVPIILFFIIIITAIASGCLCFKYGRRQRMTKNQDDGCTESKHSLKDALHKTSTNILQNFSPHRNRKNEKHVLNNTRSDVPLIPQKSFSASSDIINESNELNNTLLRSTNNRPKNSRHSSVTSQPTYPPRYSTLRPNSQTSANVHSDTLDKQYAEADTLCYPNNKHTSSRQSMPPTVNCSNPTGNPMNTIERRQKRAEDETKEIMRDSSGHMVDTENSIMALMNSSNDDSRKRLDSDDSGKGESPRNSLKTEEEGGKAPPQIPSPSDKPKRPMSLPMAPGANQQHRTRLNSEPTMESSPHTYHQKRKMPQRTHSMMSQGSMPYTHYASMSRPQATTPNGPPMYSPMYHQPKQMNNNYSTLDRKVVPPPYHHQMSIQHPKYNNNNSMTHNFEMYNNPQNKFSSLPVRRSKVNAAYSIPPNRGSNGSDYANAYPQHNALSRQISNPPAHYSTLQHQRSTSKACPERPSTLQRREKLPSMMRQTSNSTNPKFVPPPKIPSAHQTIDENCAV